jgi:hypothetical protein
MNTVEVSACTCLQPPAPNVEFNKRNAVFVGKAVFFELDSVGIFPRRKITFEILKSWKGITSSDTIIYTLASSAACGFEFIKDSVYLIYADSSSHRLTTDICTRTKLYSSAIEDLAYLQTISGTHYLPIEAPALPVRINSYPNPGNPSISIQYSIPSSANIRIILYAVSGQEIETLYEGIAEQGTNELNFNASHLATGTYFASVHTQFGTATTKMLIIK